MANTFFGLNIGTLGIQAANVNLYVTANNISNEHTRGYSRQVSMQQATRPLRVNQRYGMIGSGVEVTSVNRMRNEYFDIKYQQNQTRLGESSSKYYYMLKIEDCFNESKVDGFTGEFDKLYDSLEELKKQPENPSTRNNFLNYAESFLEYIQKNKSDLKIEQEDINLEISNNVNTINSLSEEIGALNKQINIVEITGAKANELRDRRAVLLDELSLIAEVKTSEKTYDNGKSEFTLKLGDNILVDNYDFFTLKVVSRNSSANADDSVGLYDIEWSYGQEFNPLKEGVSGTLKSLLEMRDGNNGVVTSNQYSYVIKNKGIPYYTEQINGFLDSFTTMFNDIHSGGKNLYDQETTDIPIFVQTDLGKYIINPDIKEDTKLLATAYETSDGVSQFNLVDELIATKNNSIYKGGTARDFLQSLVTEISVDTRKSKNLTDNYQNMSNTIENQRLSIMGVDKDEEAMNLIKYKEAFDLSSKVISIMAEIYDKLINETGI